jgi:hypothetical protein
VIFHGFSPGKDSLRKPQAFTAWVSAAHGGGMIVMEELPDCQFVTL